MESPDISRCEKMIIGGFTTVKLTSSELARTMAYDCLVSHKEKQLPKLVFSSNGHSISLAGISPEFNDIMQKADIIHADGMSIVIASRIFFRKPLPERITTTDFFHEAAKTGEEYGLKFYFLGGQEEVNAKAYAMAKQLYPKIRWVGRHHGFFEAHEEVTLCNKIREAKPDVLWVGLGRPIQEMFSVRNREKLVGIGWIKTCGGLFDFLAGGKRRAPQWMQRTGLEWLWRVIQEPKRLLWRYLFTNVYAIWRLAIYTRATK